MTEHETSGAVNRGGVSINARALRARLAACTPTYATVGHRVMDTPMTSRDAARGDAWRILRAILGEWAP